MIRNLINFLQYGVDWLASCICNLGAFWYFPLYLHVRSNFQYVLTDPEKGGYLETKFLKPPVYFESIAFYEVTLDGNRKMISTNTSH